ncbi:hypothetical protein ACQKQD_11910 [Methylobacterium sp. NPDC080182]|uniref:hypothetical protein n=1 Tax=unclassified Methylobacterium TaxID=2615210 RepID=UPI0008A79497|nr:hypothetical protein [Methylobacterium sp. 275MFSha3.1]SEI15660.1 hypothetical protein SAMN02799636_06091 [Methylobacterium sp. 275MFSha3.1]
MRETGKREFGTRLISGGASCELGGTVSLEFAPRGLRRSFDVPLDGLDRLTAFVAPTEVRPVDWA